MDREDSDAGWVPEEKGEAGDPGTGKPGFAKGRVLSWPGSGSFMSESWRGETPWREGENESLEEGVRW